MRDWVHSHVNLATIHCVASDDARVGNVLPSQGQDLKKSSPMLITIPNLVPFRIIAYGGTKVTTPLCALLRRAQEASSLN